MRKKLIALAVLAAVAIFFAYLAIDSVLNRQQTDVSGETYPAETYDTEESEAKLLEGLGEISRNEATAVAARFLGVLSSTLKYDAERKMRDILPVYSFTANISGNKVKIEVTKSGGYVLNVSSSRVPITSGLSEEEAVKIAEKLLGENGFSNMTLTENIAENKTVRMAFAYAKDGVLNDEERIVVTIGRDNGSVINFDSYDYIMRHQRV